jgi:hypothetical protein
MIRAALALFLSLTPLSALAAGAPAQDKDKGKDGAPLYLTTMPEVRHRFAPDMVEKMRNEILRRTGRLPEPNAEAEEPPAAKGH